MPSSPPAAEQAAVGAAMPVVAPAAASETAQTPSDVSASQTRFIQTPSSLSTYRLEYEPARIKPGFSDCQTMALRRPRFGSLLTVSAALCRALRRPDDG